MNQKIFLGLTISYLFILVLFSFFPQFFTDLKPNDELIKLKPPSKGINLFRIENVSSQETRLDSLTIDWGYKKETTEIDKTLQPMEEIEISKQIDPIFSTSVHKQVRIYIHQKHPVRLKVYYNDNRKPILLLPFESFSNGAINKYLFTGIKKSRSYAEPIQFKTTVGTDSSGRDVWTRIVYGTGIVIKIVLFSLLISVPLGILTGLITGFYRGWVSYFIESISNFVTTLPVFLLAMIIVMIFEQKIMYIVIAFSFVQWVEIQKIIKIRITFLKEKEFVAAAEIFGKSKLSILFTDLLILCIPEIIIGAIFLAKRIILIETSLSFLRYSVEIPHPSWGAILASNRSNIYHHLWISLPPTLIIIMTLFSMNYLEKYFRNRYRRNA